MVIALYLIAFPLLPIVFGVRWLRATRAYTETLIKAGAYERPTADEFVSTGPVRTTRRIARSRASIDEEVRRGRMGAEALRQLKRERSAWLALAASIPVGFVLLFAIAYVVTTGERVLGLDSSQVVILVVFLIAYLVVLATLTRVLARLARQGARGAVLATLLGIVSSLVGAWIGIHALVR